MKSSLLLAAAAFAGFSAAQDGLPKCAKDCATELLTGASGSCGGDTKCICADSAFINNVACCLAKPGGCNADEQNSAVVYASQLCAANGVTVPTAVSCASTAASTTAGGSTSAGSGSTPTGSASSTSATAATNSPSSSRSSSALAPKQTAMGGMVLGGLVAAVAML